MLEILLNILFNIPINKKGFIEMINIKKDLMTIKQTSDLLDVCIKSIFNYIKQGKLKSIRLGGSTKKAGKTYIHIDEIKQFLKG